MPSWSRDGTRIVFRRTPVASLAPGSPAPTPTIAMLNTDGTGLRTVVSDDPCISAVAWAADSQAIIYTTRAGAQPCGSAAGSTALRQVNVDGTGGRQLANPGNGGITFELQSFRQQAECAHGGLEFV